MGKIEVPVGAVLSDGLSFAGHRFETALRFVWVPVLVSLGASLMLPRIPWLFVFPSPLPSGAVTAAALALIGMIVTASYMAPLTRLAAWHDEPSHRSIPNQLRGQELRWFLGYLLSVGGLYLVVQMPLSYGAAGVEDLAAELARTEVATFAEGSLHSVELVPAYETWFLAAMPMAAAAFVGILVIYLQLRLFPLPAYAALAGPDHRYSIVGRTLAASAGWNLLRLAAIVVLTALANMALAFIIGLAPVLIAFALGAAYPVLATISAFESGGEIAPWVRDALDVTGIVVDIAFLMLVTAFGAALNAGVLGSIVRRTMG